MIKPDKKSIRIVITAAVPVLIAYLCRLEAIYKYAPLFMGLLRSFIYVGLFMLWGYSLRKRIIQTQARRYLMAIASLIVFWFLVRTVKYHFVSEAVLPTFVRYLWYLFYLPMLMIPLLAIFVSLSIGKPEDYRLPKRTVLYYIPVLAAILLVLTNDLHQFVFTFPETDPVWRSSNNGYGAGYFLVIAILIFCGLEMLWVLWRKCRLPGRKRRVYPPCIPIALLLLYMAFYYMQVEWLRIVCGDVTAMTCLLYMITLELCIRCGLIQANIHYEDLFASASRLSAQITDNQYRVCYSSRDAEVIPEEKMREAESAPVMLPGGKLLHNMPIRGGHALWTEDISELLSLREKLEETKEELKDRNDLLQYEYQREREHKIVEEQNRLYDMLQRKTQIQLDKIGRLVSMYQNSDSGEAKKQILPKIVVLGSFIKRRKDFVLSIDSTPTIPESKLTGALGESFRALALMNVGGAYLVHTGEEYLPGEVLTLAYDFFEDVVETLLDSLKSINVRVFPVQGKLRISILADGSGELKTLKEKYPKACILQEDGIELVLSLEGAGRMKDPRVLIQIFLVFLIFMTALCEFMVVLINKIRRGKTMRQILTGCVMLAVLFVLMAVWSRYYRNDTFYPAEKKSPLFVLTILVLLVSVFQILAEILYNRKQGKNQLSPYSIKEATDDLPTGVCFADAAGRIILCNRKMGELSACLMGGYPQTAEELEKALAGPQEDSGVRRISDDPALHCFPDRKIWQFHLKNLSEPEGFLQITAQDMTEIYHANERLRKKNEEMQQVNEKLRKMYERLTDRIREQETLDLKMRIHNNIGTSLIAISGMISGGDEEDIGKQLEILKDAVSYLSDDCPAVPGTFDEVRKKAGEMKVSLVLRGSLPQEAEAESLIIAAARECVTNCVNHAGGNRVTAEVVEHLDIYTVTITNNGRPPENPIVEGGGLSNLRRRVESAGGEMYLSHSPSFALILNLPRKEQEL